MSNSQIQSTGNVIRVRAPARLHMGFLDPDGVLGRKFGSVGLAISEPATTLTLQSAQQNTCQGGEQARVASLRDRFKDAFKIDGNFAISVDQAIPAHAGLGSGTQLALALGAAMQSFAGKPYAPEQLGALVDRGARSAIGITAFHQGGFIVDGGKREAAVPPPATVTLPFPDDWRIILALDHDAKGVHGDRERDAFENLVPLGKGSAAHLCHITMMQMLPALVDQDLDGFGAAITEMQAIIGDYFAPAQGNSRFSSPRVAEIVKQMSRLGGKGLGQSSWGPTGFCFVENQNKAESLYTTLVEEAKASGVDLLVVAGRNTGATIESAQSHR